MKTPKPLPKKFSAPQLERALLRTKLFRAIDKAAPITWIHASPGAGKTTLVASYLATRRLPHLWYQVGARDGDAGALFYYLSEATKRISARGNPLPLLTPDRIPGLSVFTLRYFEALYARFDQRFVVVFDNYQDAPADAPLHDIMRNALSVLPHHGRVIVISRNGPPPALARLRAESRLTLLNEDALRLTENEAYAMARLVKRKPINREIIQELHRRTNGWAAGLTLCLAQANIAQAANALLERVPQLVFDYFAGEIFSRLDSTVTRTLMQTASLPIMSTESVTMLTGQSNSPSMLADMSRHNYFTLRSIDAQHRPTYQYHPLFREFLLAQAESHFNRSEWTDIQRRAASLLQAEGHIDEAVSLLQKTEDWESLAQLIVKNAQPLVAQGRGQALITWINTLPRGIVSATPWLLYWLGVCQSFWSGLGKSFYNVSESMEHLRGAFELFRKKNDRVGMFVTWGATARAIQWSSTDFHKFNELVPLLKSLLAESPVYPSMEIEALVSEAILRILAWSDAETIDAQFWSANAVRILNEQIENGLSTSARIDLSTTLIWYSTLTGNYQQATAAIKVVSEIARSRELTASNRLVMRTAELPYLLLVAGDFKKCIELSLSSMEYANEAGAMSWYPTILYNGLAAALCMNDVKLADELFERALTLPRARRFQHVHFNYMAAWHAHIHSNYAAMLSHAQTQIEEGEKLGLPFFTGLGHHHAANALHGLSRNDEAIAHVRKAATIAERINSDLLKCMALFAEAIVRLDEGETEATSSLLAQAFSIARRHNIMNTPSWHGSTMSSLCAHALSVGIEVEFVQSLVRQRNLTPPSFDIEHWPRQFRISTFGDVRIEREGTPSSPLNFGGKPMELLKALIAFGGRDVPERRICDALWPDADRHSAHKAFAINLHRLRKFFGCDDAFELKQKQLSLDARYCWVDVWAFERLTSEAAAEPTKPHKNEAAKLERGLSLYKGPFLGDGLEPWALSARERLHNKFLRLSARLGEWWEQLGEWQRAIAWYRRVLDADPLAEDFYFRLMRSYQQTGNDADALSVYEQCRRTLTRQLNTEPSTKTQELFRALRGGAPSGADHESLPS